MEVAFGYRAPLPEKAEAPTVIAFLPGWVGYAWAFPRVDHISFGIATTQDAFEHKALDQLLWQFMVGYYHQREDGKTNIWKRKSGQKSSAIEQGLKTTAETICGAHSGSFRSDLGQATRIRRRLGLVG